MSHVITTHIWKHSQHKDSVLLLLLAIGDFADERGWAYPSAGTLAKMLRMTERNVRKLVDKAEASGELVVYNQVEKEGSARHFSNVYFMPSPTSDESQMPERISGYTRRRSTSITTTVVSHGTLPNVPPDTTPMSHGTLPSVPPDTTVVSRQTSDPLKDPSIDPSTDSSYDAVSARARANTPERESHHPKAAAADQSASLKIKSIDSKPSPEASRLAKTPTPPVSPPPPKRVPPKVRQVEADPHWRAFVGTFDDEAAPPVTDANAGSLLAAIETMRARGITPEDVAETTRWKLSEPRRKPYRFEYVITDVYERRQIKPKKGRAGQAIHDPDFLLSTPTGCETIIGDPHQSDFMKRLARETLAEKWHVYDPKGMRVVDLPDDFDLDEAERLFNEFQDEAVPL